MSHPLHEVHVGLPVVRSLLREQHPDLADLPLRPAARGWDNVTVRLGDELAVRLPARALAAPLIEHEQQWLPVLAPVLRAVGVQTPVPVRVGRPGTGYPWHWSVVPWLPGVPADTVTAAQRDPWAEHLASALAALHTPAAADAPVNPFRGRPLAERDEAVSARLAAVAGTNGAALRQAWSDGLAAPEWSGHPVWLHGDPHPGNLLAGSGGLAALLDFGDLTAGDPATDLATAWLCFGPDGRARFWDTYASRSTVPHGELDALQVRARAWAAALVPAMLAHPLEHPGLVAVGDHASAQLLAD